MEHRVANPDVMTFLPDIGKQCFLFLRESTAWDREEESDPKVKCSGQVSAYAILKFPGVDLFLSTVLNKYLAH